MGGTGAQRIGAGSMPIMMTLQMMSRSASTEKNMLGSTDASCNASCAVDDVNADGTPSGSRWHGRLAAHGSADRLLRRADAMPPLP